MDRRSFLTKVTSASALAAAAVAVSYPGKSTHAQVKFRWRLAHSFGPTAPVYAEALKNMADNFRVMTKGRLDIKIFAGGELVPAFGVFDAVKQGALEMFFSASYYWAGKVPATQFTCSVPFGMTPQQVSAWFYGGDGLKLWQEFYAKHGLMVFQAGNTGVQMGGWFRKEIKSIDDFKGLKMRIPGLGGKVVAAVGGVVVLLPGPEIFPALERGVIDATEWVGPLYDWHLGLHQAAKYYYSPGYHEPGTNNEMTTNMKSWDSLPPEFQKMIEISSAHFHVWTLANYDAQNNEYLKKIVDYGIQLRHFPDDVLRALHKAAERINDEVADSDPEARKVYDSYKKFRDGIRTWYSNQEYAYTAALKAVGVIDI